MKTNITQFEASHGRKPSGKGFWAFEITFTDGQGRCSSETVFESGTLASARKLAWSNLKREVGGAKELVEVTVLP
jgi:hypothetical protein